MAHKKLPILRINDSTLFSAILRTKGNDDNILIGKYLVASVILIFD